MSRKKDTLQTKKIFAFFPKKKQADRSANDFFNLLDDSLYDVRVSAEKNMNFEYSSELYEHLNDQQKIAVSNMVQSLAFPFPYILNGPPGKLMIN